jgi:hypothetical protein
MKKFIFYCSLILVFFSCSVNKKPIFLKLDNIKIISFSKDTLQLKADAFFENPNDVGGKISTDEIKVIVNDVEVASVISKDFKVPAKKEFAIPLKAKIATKKLLNTNKKGFLSGLINSLLTQKINVKIKGKLDYVVFGFKKEFLIDKTEEVKIKF